MKNIIVKRAFQEIKEGMYINLGIGIPTLIANELQNTNMDVFLQSENGLLGIGPYPLKSEVDPDLINAGKETVTIANGASFFDSAFSFGMIRSGRIDLAILGGMEVSQNGDLANYMIPKKLVKGMGGAMDLVNGAKKIVVVMEHTNKAGESKIKKACSLPLTGKGVVDKLITNLCVFEFENSKMKLVELLGDTSLEDVKKATLAEFEVCL